MVIQEIAGNVEAFHIISIILPIISIIVTVILGIFTAKQQEKMKFLESRLEIKKSELDARREYRYKAIYRIFTEVEPYRAQFLFLSDRALKSISIITEWDKEDRLGKKFGSKDHTDFKKTMYDLLAPLAAYILLKSQLTPADMALIPSIQYQYLLGEILPYTFSDDRIIFDILKRCENIQYHYLDQSEASLDEKKANPDKFKRQGISASKIESIASALIVQESNRTFRIMNFNEFLERYEEEKLARHDREHFDLMLDRFLNFTPRSHPVLWCILIAQLYVYVAIKNSKTREYIEFWKPTPDEYFKPAANKLTGKLKWPFFKTKLLSSTMQDPYTDDTFKNEKDIEQALSKWQNEVKELINGNYEHWFGAAAEYLKKKITDSFNIRSTSSQIKDAVKTKET
jgi:hypothetical protein